nr:phage tail length tape measure family protein [Tabrizicola sp. SY72]
MTPVIRQVGQTAAASNAHLANLGFQANDIFMMMAAGQNPMMLAIQQGTQVSQVFGMMRKEGQALGPAIRSALMGMVSPMSLVTMGAIALGAFAVQALMSTGEAALTFEDRLKTLTDTMSSLRENSKLLIDDSVSAKFGAMQQQARQLVDALVALDRASELKQLRTTLDARFAQDIEPSFLQKYSLLLAQGQAPNFPNVDLAAENFNELGTSMSFEDFKQLRAEIDQLAADGKIEEVTAKIVELGLAMKGDGQFSALGEGAQGLFRDLAKLALGTAETEAIFNGSARREAGNTRADELIAAAGRENELARLKLAYGEQSAEVRAEEARQARAALETEIQRLGIGEASSRAEQMRADLAERLALAEDQRQANRQTAADQMMAQHQQEARIVELTARWGADSLEVAYARAAAERQVYEAQLAAQGISGEMAADLLDAWDAARGVASVNMAAGIGAAAAEAQLLASMLGVSLNQAVALMGLAGKATKAAGTPGRLGFGIAGSAADGLGLGPSAGLSWGDNPGAHQSTAEEWRPYRSLKEPKGGGGAKKEADALAELIQREREQIDALRILDPVQAEILKNHEALKGATDAEKQSVADLIAERLRLEEIRDRLDQIGETGRNAFQQLLSGATSFGGALAMVLDKLAEMLASDAWDMIWGGGGLNLGGLIGGLFGLAPAKADGGKVTGPGGPRDDNLLHWLSNGEFVVNAAATRNAQPLLEAINAGVPVDRLMDIIGGRRPGFADGGLVGSSAPRGWRMATDSGSAGSGPASTGGAGGKMQLDIRIGMDRDGNWRAAVRDIASDVSLEVSQIVVDEWSRQALPGRVAEIDSNPRVRG